MTAQENLEWSAERALEYFDMEDRAGAIASFISDVGKHEGTAWIAQEPMFMLLLNAEYDRGRIAFERFLLGFSVREVRA